MAVGSIPLPPRRNNSTPSVALDLLEQLWLPPACDRVQIAGAEACRLRCFGRLATSRKLP